MSIDTQSPRGRQNTEVTERIQHAMIRSGMSQKAIATRLGISETYLSDIVKGRRSVSAFVAVRMERVLGLNAQLLMYAQVNAELAAARAEFAKVLARA